MGKKKNEQGLETFLKSEFLDQYQNKTPSGYKVVEKYPLLAPFSYVNILEDKETAGYLYQVDEVKLNNSEQMIFEKLYSLIEDSLDSPENITKDLGFTSFLNKTLKENEKMFQEYPLASIEKVKYYLERDIAGFGLIDSLMHDPNIEDVSCSGIDTPIYVWHRKYDSMPTNIQFEDERLNNFVSRIVFRAGKHISSAFPISDLALEGNHRISVLYQKEVTPKGTSFTIRKFREDPYTVVDLINFGTLDINIAAYLWMLVESKMSIIVIGSTGSGKTTILNAITGLINPDYKIFSVEDVAEININHENWFSLISRTGFGASGEGEIGLYDLIKSGVRHRPDYIAVGEIRGSEAYVMFQAMATGHGGLCTMHADSLESASKRLQQKPMDIPPAYLSLMNCAIVIRRVKNNVTGQSSRKAVTVQEIISADSFNDVFNWNPKTDEFDSKIEQSKMLYKISEQTGQDMEEIINEFEKRKKLLRHLTERGIRSYKKVSEYVGMYYRDSDALLAKMEYGV
ncbi:type II/IV secretion system ATPase subunit [Nitrosopumilus sp. K4]|uniref:type II/IV secretion system ATPase subunit n=1 Tax=Nitrosopumilus sp. K4 TaxID=2795383 RepID=UPI001BA5DC1E|nr:type II/IV secretion system ATPase subunit [Nitrosopumilus sp. K4]QUC65460.1 type II/IV secretion system ATPase subunit [Nitrosopumilus sp. K4]